MSKSIYYVSPLMVEKREERGYTQQELADYLTLEIGRPFSKSIVQKWEQGEKPISTDTALEVAKALKVQVLELVEKKV